MRRLLLPGVIFLLFISISSSTVVQAQKWNTLSGSQPLVIARGGFSGLLPDSSDAAYSLSQNLAGDSSLVLWCDVRLTKDGVPICLSDINLANQTNIVALSLKTKTYIINGESVQGYFPIDFTYSFLYSNISLIQGLSSRTNLFDNLLPITTPQAVGSVKPRSPLWLNIQHDLFYSQHGLSMRSSMISLSKQVVIDYISSPEVGFLKSIISRISSKTKLVYRFLDLASSDPSVNQTYSSILKNLTFVKTFASGILVPKTYIWPTNSDQYLLPHSSLVSDAHKVGLEVYASDFANDNILSYNYSYDPVSEYLSFTSNPDFSIDGLLTDFSVTAAEAIGCFAHASNQTSHSVKPLIITNNGASGIYPGSTDSAYKEAVKDGADIIDCAVQITKDGIPICLPDVDLLVTTNIAGTKFGTLATNIPEIQSQSGIFTFDLTWEDILTLKPVIQSPQYAGGFYRNPAFKNEGSFMTLSEFLAYTKDLSITGILIEIENAAYLASNRSVSVIDTVVKALQDHSNQTKQDIYIKSKDSATLIKMKQQTSYKLVYEIVESIGSIIDSALQDIKKFADAVTLTKGSIFTSSNFFTTGTTGNLEKMKAANLSVFVYPVMNEFVTVYLDFFSDPTAQINALVAAGVDGLITDFPATARAFFNNACYDLKTKPKYIQVPPPGGLLQGLMQALTQGSALTPSPPPSPALTESDVVEPPLPPVSSKTPNNTVAAPTSHPSGASSVSVSVSLLILFITTNILMYYNRL